jgi:hypothetical protein
MNTNRGGNEYGGTFPALDLFQTPPGQPQITPTCTGDWVSLRRVRVVCATLTTDSTLILVGNVTAACDLPPSQQHLCDGSWGGVSGLRASVQRPFVPTPPGIDISVPEAVGACSDLVVDTSGSRGSGGR